MPGAAGRRYLLLDGLRGVAAIAVFAFHGRAWLPSVLSVQHGYLAVDFFFMLSGFVIAHAYERRLRLGEMRLLGFARLRAIRLYPLIVCGTTLGLVPFWLAVRHAHGQGGLRIVLAAYALNVLALPAQRYGVSHFPLDTPVWSLGCEIAVNLAYAISVRWLSTGLLSGIAALSFAVLARWIVHYGMLMDVGPVVGPASAIMARTVFSFSVGVLVHRFHAAGRLPAARLGPATLTAMLCASFLPVGQIVASPLLTELYDVVCIALLYPLIIVSACETPSIGAWGPAAKVAADLSFPIYALHVPCVMWLGLIAGPVHPPGAKGAMLYLAVMASVTATCWWAAKVDAAMRQGLTRWTS